MLILDTNHVTEIVRGATIGQALIGRLTSAAQPIATTIVTIEELLRGWLARLRGEQDPDRAIPLYAKLQAIMDLAASWTALGWDDQAAAELRKLNAYRLGVGTMDLKIASIALANRATLLSRNLRDFERVPNLFVEDWLS